ncbi:MAG: HEAT repeat domain-containing protein [Myxococcales bacterium]|nr:HEAT repeat domain-containing protein [Myxococcales bacterium]
MSTNVTRFRERCRCHGVSSSYAFPVDPGAGPRPFKLPGDPERFGRPRAFDVKRLVVELSLDLGQHAVDATATLTVSRKNPSAKTLILDAVGFVLHSVTDADGRALEHRYDGDQLHVEMAASAVGAESVVRVRYRAVPPRGLYFMGPAEHRPNRPWQVWSQCQDEDARYWIPCHDYPNMRMSTEFIVLAPEGWHVLSNGTLVSRAPAEGTHGMDPALIGATGPGLVRWHWQQREPHVAYLMTLVAGRFSEIVADTDALSVRYYVDPGREDDAKRSFGRTPEMIQHFERLFGVKFPWAKYHQIAVHDFTFGGMENTSATTMTDRILIDARAALDNTADDIVAHELAHQWFGDLVTCRDWSHAWLNEGFATFCEHLDAEKKHGWDEYRYSLEEHAHGYFSEDRGRYRRAIVCATYNNPIDLFDRHLYEKGGWVLHMLRCELGDAQFFGGVRRYLAQHRGGIVETRDLLRAMEEESGRSLEGFFDQWVYRAGHPELEVKGSHDPDSGLLTVRVKQKQAVDAVTPLFRFTLEVTVSHGRSDETHALEVSGAEHVFVLPCKKAPDRVNVDPRGALLATWSFDLPRDWLLDALERAPSAVVRFRAAHALSKRDEPAVVDALANAVRNDEFWGVSVEAAGALGAMGSKRAFDALAKLVDVAHPKVRRAVVAALGEFKTDSAAKLLASKLVTGDASVLVESELARSAGRTRKRELVWDALVTALGRESWRDFVRVGAIDGLARLRSKDALSLIEPYSARSASLGTRRTAVSAMAELGHKDRDVREKLELLIDLNDPYFTPELFRALVKLGDSDAIGAIERAIAKSIDGRVQRHGREASRALRSEGGSADELRRLREQLEHVEQRARALEDAVATLEAKVSPAKNEKKSEKKTARKKSARPAKKSARRR